PDSHTQDCCARDPPFPLLLHVSLLFTNDIFFSFLLFYSCCLNITFVRFKSQEISSVKKSRDNKTRKIPEASISHCKGIRSESGPNTAIPSGIQPAYIAPIIPNTLPLIDGLAVSCRIVVTDVCTTVSAIPYI